MADLLIDALDAGAKKLLEMAMAEARNADGSPNLATLAERVKAFDSVAAWAETRRGLTTPEKERTKFDELREQFDGSAAAAEGGRTVRKTKKNGSANSGGSVNGGQLAVSGAQPADGADTGFFDS